MLVGSIARLRPKLVAALLLPALLVAACGGDGGDENAAGASSECKPSGGKVNLTVWSFEPNAREAVEIWNRENPDIQVDLKEVPGGIEGTYQKYTNGLEAGSGLPDIGMIEFDTLPVFRLKDGLANMAPCGAQEAKDEFPESVWSQLSFGEPNAVYGTGIDIGPMALYYRADLFEKYGIEVPETWDDFAEAARTVHEQDDSVYLTNVSSVGGGNWFTTLAWQSGAHWFAIEGDKWHVDITDDPTMRVADYWQELIDAGLVSHLQNYSEAWNRDIVKGKVLTHLGAGWSGDIIASGAPSTKGDWRVAPMPQWESGARQSANWGGSAYSVFKTSKHPYEATQFAVWINTDPRALARLGGGAFPAATAGLASPEVTGPNPFYGGQRVNEVFAEASENIDDTWQWGPTMSTTYATFSDDIARVLAGDTTMREAFEATETKTIRDMEAQGLQVEKR